VGGRSSSDEWRGEVIERAVDVGALGGMRDGCSAWGEMKGTSNLEVGTSSGKLQNRQWWPVGKKAQLTLAHHVLGKMVLQSTCRHRRAIVLCAGWSGGDEDIPTHDDSSVAIQGHIKESMCTSTTIPS
jgi:hypothetical protein